MVGMYPYTTFDRNPTASSIDTPLHAFIPYAHVDHMHPVAVIALATAKDGPALTREVYGDDVIWTNWQRPGFELGLELERVCREHPNAKGAILGQHGLINWANDDKECYELTLDLIRRAQEFLDARAGKAGLRRRASVQSLPEAERRARAGRGAAVAARQGERGEAADRDGRDARRGAGVRELARRAAAGRAGDELPRPLPAHEDQAALRGLESGGRRTSTSLKKVLDGGARRSIAPTTPTYYEQCKRPDSPAIRVSSPSVILVPGVGLIAWGKSKSESRVTAEFYNAAIGVMRGAERVSQYIALDRQEAFDIEYWLLEEAKLKRMPAEKPLDRQVVVVVGAGSGIGRGLLARLRRRGRERRGGGSRRRQRRVGGGGRAAEEGRHGDRRRGHGHLRRGAGRSGSAPT